MLQTVRSRRGMVVAPHHLAARAGARILEEGGNAIEAMVAAASAIAITYPHMNGLGGDNFWLIHTPGQDVVGIDACGGAAGKADCALFKAHDKIPERGPLAALTVAGAVSGWQEALTISRSDWGGTMPIDRLLEEATFLADDGIAVTRTQAVNTAGKLTELSGVPGYTETYLDAGTIPQEGDRFRQPRLAETLRHLVRNGFENFYRGDLAKAISADLMKVGSPLELSDLERHRALRVKPLSVSIRGHQVYNMPPPTQGLASLMLLGIYAQLGVAKAEGFEFVHGLLEATKLAFLVRDRHVSDPIYMNVDPASFLDDATLEAMAADIDPIRALPWPEASAPGDTVWLGAIDGQGRAVSFIQSIYWEFGSGVVLDETGITWQNRGVSFSLDPEHHNLLMPHRRPFHTIQPALAHLTDGRVMIYGTMGGEGQPQTQAMLFARHVLHGQDLQQAVSAPRWLLGRTWGAEATNIRIENRIDPAVIEALRSVGHDVGVIGPFDEVMGHAGALVRHPDGLMEGAADPRSDGQVAAF